MRTEVADQAAVEVSRGGGARDPGGIAGDRADAADGEKTGWSVQTAKDARPDRDVARV